MKTYSAKQISKKVGNTMAGILKSKFR